MYEDRKCWLCGRNGENDPLDKHHCFQGKNRDNSERYGLVVYLCHSRCHLGYGAFGKNAVHKSKETERRVHEYAQKKAMEENGWDVDDFIGVFGRNYL